MRVKTITISVSNSWIQNFDGELAKMKSPLHHAALALALTLSLSLSSTASAQTPAATPKSGSQGSTTATKKPATSATHSAYDRALLHPALLKDKAPDTYVVKFVTTRGDFTITVTRASAPLGADRFYNLVKHHFYDNAVIFRAVPNFVTQFGISSYPAVSTAWKKTEIKDDPVTGKIKKARSSSPPPDPTPAPRKSSSISKTTPFSTRPASHHSAPSTAMA